jgi:O-acetyl-ADP-ribose deacetylase (regulator of RNase III)
VGCRSNDAQLASVTERIVAQHTVDAATVLVVHGDLTAQEVDAVVNAANERLVHGGGVAAALSRAGGPEVQRQSDAWVHTHGPLRSGDAAVTTAGHLPARWIIHVAGPRWHTDQDNERLLQVAVVAALDKARDLGATSIALPAISSGIFGYPRAEATAVIASTVLTWLRNHPGSLAEVRLMGYDSGTAGDFARGLVRSHPDRRDGSQGV